MKSKAQQHLFPFFSKGAFLLLVFLILALEKVNATLIERASSSEGSVKPMLNFRNIHGLNNNQVKFICQDYEGFIWIGTLNGLHKFDGSSFTLYETEKGNDKSLPHSRIETIFEDAYKNLWIGTSDGVCRYNRDQDNFDQLEADSDLVDDNSPHPHRILDFREDADGMLWTISNREGLFYFDDDLQKFESYFEKEDLDKLTSLQFSALEIDQLGNVWLGTFDQGINILNPKTREIVPLRASPGRFGKTHSNRINDIVRGRENTIWVGMDNGGIDRLIWASGVLDVKHYANQPENQYTLQNDDVASLYSDPDGRLWSCNENGGLNLYDSKIDGFQRYVADLTNFHSMSSHSIWCVFQDNENRVWLGTGLSGVDVSDPSYNKFAHYFISAQSVNGMTSNIIRDFWEDEKGGIWIATDGGGLNLFDRKSNKFTSYEHDPTNNKSISVNAVLSIEEGPDSQLWLGTWSGGVNIFNREKKTFEKLKTPSDINLKNVFECYKDRNDNMWFATYLGGLVKYDLRQRTFRSFVNDPNDSSSIGGDMMHGVFEDSKGNIYVGVRNLGLNVLKKENIEAGIFQRFVSNPENDKSIPSNIVNQVYEDNTGIIWVATTEGLAKFDIDKSSFETLKRNTGINSMDIRSVIEDQKNNLWVRTIEGISKLDRRIATFKNYTPADGVQKGSFLRHTLNRTKKGELLFAGDKGFNLFHPDELKNLSNPPEMYFTDFKIFNKSVQVGSDTSVLKKHISQTKSITLRHEYWKFRLEFVAINFTRSENNEYAYIMEGLETNWNYVGNQLSATYTHLPPGAYTFRVKAANNDGVWNSDGIKMEIIVKPAWWQTWWANVAYVVLFITLFFSFIRYRTRKLQIDRHRLEHLIESRMIELREKNTEIILQAEELKRKNGQMAVLNSSMSEQAEELKSYNDALNAVNENLEKIVESRTNNLKIKNEQLMTYSFENAHNVRGPLTRLMGLINLAMTDDNSNVRDLLVKMNQASFEMDQITRSIGKKLDKHFKDHN